MCNTVGYGHTVRLAWTVECTMDNGTPQCLMEMGRGGACVPTRVAPQGCIHRSIPHTQCMYIWYGNATARTFGRAHRHRPYGFVWWIAHRRLVSFGWIACGRLVAFGWIVCKWLFCLCEIVWKNIMEFGRGGVCVPARVAPQGRIHRSIPRTQCVCFCYGNAAARTFGRAHRHRPYGSVWVDCMWVVWFVCWENGAHEPTPSVLYF